MSEAIRRAAGTVTFSDLLRQPRRLLGRFGGDSAARAADADAAAFAAGEARVVTAFAHEGRRLRQGLLVLDPASPTPVTWHRTMRPRPGPSPVPLSAPFDVLAVTPGTPRRAFTLVTFTAAATPWALAVPALDLPLVHAALSRANAQA
ncbi:hypothetical protein [Streptomyces sp. NPDC021020]|uniref:hypothetical protein n=1 Tax=Streptomyces sp. NPDC021020 TaxID=3365109 RepID=UPI0037A57562